MAITHSLMSYFDGDLVLCGPDQGRPCSDQVLRTQYCNEPCDPSEKGWDVRYSCGGNVLPFEPPLGCRHCRDWGSSFSRGDCIGAGWQAGWTICFRDDWRNAVATIRARYSLHPFFRSTCRSGDEGGGSASVFVANWSNCGFNTDLCRSLGGYPDNRDYCDQAFVRSRSCYGVHQCGNCACYDDLPENTTGFIEASARLHPNAPSDALLHVGATLAGADTYGIQGCYGVHPDCDGCELTYHRFCNDLRITQLRIQRPGDIPIDIPLGPVEPDALGEPARGGGRIVVPGEGGLTDAEIEDLVRQEGNQPCCG